MNVPTDTARSRHEEFRQHIEPGRIPFRYPLNDVGHAIQVLLDVLGTQFTGTIGKGGTNIALDCGGCVDRYHARIPLCRLDQLHQLRRAGGDRKDTLLSIATEQG